MNSRRLAFASALFLCVVAAASAQVPQLINYQGRVTVGGTAFTGTGQFKFALVDGTGATTYWSNDGTSTAGAQPAAAVSLTVANGLYSVLLGDTTITHMTVVPVTVFANSDVRLRVWFNDGTNGSQLLTPDQRIAAVGYALMAGSVPDGAITTAKLATGAVTAGTIANGAVGSAQLATGAAAANLASGGQAGVASGGIVLSATDNPALVAAGYVKIGSTTLGDSWQQRVAAFSPDARGNHTAVWTGTEMIIWGGVGAEYFDTGARLNPATNNWTPLTAVGAPAPRIDHTAIWTGTEMIVWGGDFNDGDDHYLGNGGRYNPATDSWTAMSTSGAPSGRSAHTAIWTGTAMIIWGGYYYDGVDHYLGDGGRYNPTSDAWTAVTPTAAPSARNSHTAVWTGTEMIVWGGYFYDTSDHFYGDGARYNPSANSWTPVGATGAPVGRVNHVAVWTGTQMIVWGGGNGGVLTDGGRYNPSTDGWAPVTTSGAPSGRVLATCIWTGSEMVVWGGLHSGVKYNTGGKYNPTSNSWITTTLTGAPGGRYYHSVVWTGSEMLVWGGYGSSVTFDDGGKYDPSANTWSSLSSSAPPSIRTGHSAVWTGTEMIVWGGSSGFNDGGRYNPALNAWAPVSTTSAPAARSAHTAVWTGSTMVVWGGSAAGAYFNDGGRYDPAGDSWAAVATAGAPTARDTHTAVWTGTQMIIWGGRFNDGNDHYYADGARYNPVTDAWTAVASAAAPSARNFHTAVWTGTEMIVFGGFFYSSSDIFYNDGGRYNPTTDAWTALTGGAPSARFKHTAVWTGTDMLVWGGEGAGILGDGGRFNPTSGSWSPINASGAPAARYNHTAVWTGTEMIVWGGTSSLGLAGGGARYSPVDDVWNTTTSYGAPAARFGHTAVWTGSEMLVFGGQGTTVYGDTWSYTPGKVMFLYQKP